MTINYSYYIKRYIFIFQEMSSLREASRTKKSCSFFQNSTEVVLGAACSAALGGYLRSLVVSEQVDYLNTIDSTLIGSIIFFILLWRPCLKLKYIIQAKTIKIMGTSLLSSFLGAAILQNHRDEVISTGLSTFAGALLIGMLGLGLLECFCDCSLPSQVHDIENGSLPNLS